MNTSEVIILARSHVATTPGFESSARLALADAVDLQAAGKLDDAKSRALTSLRYSVGIFHADYKRAAK